VMKLMGIVRVGLGMGANRAIFRVVNAVLLDPVPFYDPQRLVWVSEAQDGRDYGSAQCNSYLAWQAQSQAFEHLIAFDKGLLGLGRQGAPDRLEILRANNN